MAINHPPRNRHGRPGEPSFWADEPGDDALSPLEEIALRRDEPALWGDEHADDVHSLLEENARLRGLLVQLSDLIRRKLVTPGDTASWQDHSDLQVGAGCEMTGLGRRIAP